MEEKNRRLKANKIQLSKVWKGDIMIVFTVKKIEHDKVFGDEITIIVNKK